MQRPTIFVAAAETALLKTLANLFDQAKLRYEIFTTAEAFLETCNVERPGCLLLDMSVPEMGGAELHRLLVQRHVVLPVIILTTLSDARGALAVLKNGALDFFEKPVEGEALLESVRNAISLDSANRRALRHQHEVRQLFEQLTRREREILNSMLESKSSREISELLNMSARTVEFHRARLMKKLGATSLVELVRLSITAFGCHCIHKHRRTPMETQHPAFFPHFFEYRELSPQATD
ncbi:MAG: LuxR C-terminal-related transcriptional regulator [Sideroxydans sp.]|nr:LuxR C-terminal-related transcriptional regulator [Sideroxydans sp.]